MCVAILTMSLALQVRGWKLQYFFKMSLAVFYIFLEVLRKT